MIPKILNFIWFGNNIPNYAFYCMYKFHEMNPTFHINFIHKTVHDVETLNDDILKNSYDLYKKSLKEDLTSDKLIYVRKYNLFYQKCLNKIILLSDIYRREYLYKYGGVYLDCDTFPIKPFDDELLNMEKFMIFHRNKNYFDHFFFGNKPLELCKDDRFENIFNKTIKIEYDIDQISDDIRQKFFDCKLTNYKTNKDFYFIHFCKYSWNPLNNIVEGCKLDE